MAVAPVWSPLTLKFAPILMYSYDSYCEACVTVKLPLQEIHTNGGQTLLVITQ